MSIRRRPIAILLLLVYAVLYISPLHAQVFGSGTLTLETNSSLSVTLGDILPSSGKGTITVRLTCNGNCPPVNVYAYFADPINALTRNTPVGHSFIPSVIPASSISARVNEGQQLGFNRPIASHAGAVGIELLRGAHLSVNPTTINVTLEVDPKRASTEPGNYQGDLIVVAEKQQ